MENFINCTRKDSEGMKSYTARFYNAISLYTNHIGPLNAQTTRKCISLLYKNSRLTDDNFSSAIMQCAQFCETHREKLQQKPKIVEPTKLDALKKCAYNKTSLVKENNEEELSSSLEEMTNILICIQNRPEYTNDEKEEFSI